MRIKAICICSFSLLTLVRAQSQTPGTHAIEVEQHLLHSTHGNSFWGNSIAYSKQFSFRWRLGVFAEYSHAAVHGDNSWLLTQLRFVPVGLRVGYKLLGSKKTSLYAELHPAINFIAYTKKEEQTNLTPYPVRERGLYLYAGFRLQQQLSNKLAATLGMGMKSMHLSTNDMEVNPHGVAARVGLQYWIKRKHRPQQQVN